MIEMRASKMWKHAYPGAIVGMLAMVGITNSNSNVFLDMAKEEVENDLRQRITSRKGILEHPIMKAYTNYYRHFRKSYHVLLQVESVALKKRTIPNVNAVVTAMFTAELKNYLLTAGHDLDVTEGPIILNISKGNETYTKLNGELQTLKKGDMMVSDSLGVLSDVIYGPDHRSRVTMDTTNALFVVYAPPGIPEKSISDHLDDITRFIQLASPSAVVEKIKLFTARAD